METRIKVFIISVLVSISIILAGFLSSDSRVLGISLVISIFLIIMPISLFSYLEFRKIKEMEEKFPNFLRDLIENLRAGVPLYQAIYFCSKYEYGEYLTKEIVRMANKISWGIRLENLLDEFSKRVSLSKKLPIAIQIIKETYVTGGDIIGVLEHLSESLVEVENVEKERRSMLNQYTFLMYTLSIVFLVIVVALHRFLLPLFLAGGPFTTGEFSIGKNPCVEQGIGVGGAISGIGFVDEKGNFIHISTLTDSLMSGDIPKVSCNILYYVSIILNLNFASTSSYYLSLFLLMIISQSIFAGLVAGEVSYGTVRAGIRHSLVILFINLGIFLFLVGIGILK